MERTGKQGDTTIAIIVVIAGLATGGIIAWHFLTPKPQPVYEPQYRVVDSMAEAEALAHAEAAVGTEAPGGPEAAGPAEDIPPGDTGSLSGADDEGGSDAGAAPPADDAPPSPYDDQIPDEVDRIRQQAGMTETVELTEQLYVRLSAQVVLMANALQGHPEADDPDTIQRLLAEYTAQLLAENAVDGQDYLEYTQWVADDHDRAERIGELILREAEKHTRMRINVSDVPGVSPAPVAPPDD